MEIDRTPTPTVAGPAAPKRTWVSPAVSDLGGVRELTLLQTSGTGGCDFTDLDCPFP
jgi:hypothetical protein